ncbi:B3/B4 domain-containing protein [Fusibacter bizertensis]
MIKIDKNYTDKLPDFKLGIIVAKVVTEDSSAQLLEEMYQLFESLKETLKVDQISQLKEIQAGRLAYRAFGKDPTRYRLSAEKLLRRILKGEGLDSINNVVDLSNLISLKYHCPVGTYDYEKISDDVILRAGEKGETYLSLGNQELNLEGFPIFADKMGPFGSTTSDSSRTNVDQNTKLILLSIFGFENQFDFVSALSDARALIESHAKGEILISEMLVPKKELQLR